MKVFVTGGSGHIGSRVVPELLAAGHEVVALARSDASAAKLESFDSKVNVLRGDLNDLDVLKKGASESDGVVHLGFIHDFANMRECCKIDLRAVETMCNALEGSNRVFIYTSGTLSLPSDKTATETDAHVPLSSSDRALNENDRAFNEEKALSYKDKGVRSIAVRLPPTVHGKGDRAFLPSIITTAKNKGESAYIGDGQNVWPAVHVLDAAVVFRLAFEKGIAGHVYHSISESGVKTKDIAATIGKSLGIPNILVSPDEAQERLGFLGILFGLNNRVSSDITRKELGWNPKQVLLLEDITSDDYLNSIGMLAV